MSAAKTEALASRIEDRVFDLDHLGELLLGAEDFLENHIVIPDGDSDDRRLALAMRKRAVAYVVACRLSLSTVRGDLNGIVEANLYGRPEETP